jgi:N-hydroxyarylamine O-acetyltransferase
MSHAEALTPELVERVLVKLGLSEHPAPTLEGLQALYAAWCRRVPFDNIRKLIHIHHQDPGPFPGDDATDFFEAWLTYGTGGTCWAGNGALHALLLSLGFPATRGLCTMLVAPDIPPNHGSVMVTYDETPYVVDASILHSEPLPLDELEPTAIVHPAWGVECHSREGHWYIRWRSMFSAEGLDCRIEELSVSRGTFHERHEQTRPWSPFNYELHIRLIRGDRVVGAALGQRVAYDHSGACVKDHIEADERKRLLIDELGIHEEMVQRLPADTPTPPPPWSQTAQREQG